MPRFLLLALTLALLLVPATAEGQSSLRLRGTVALKSQANDLVTVRTQRHAVALRVPGSMSLIRIGQRVELRGSMLRARGHGSQVLARNVSIASSQPLAAQTSSSKPNDDDDDEVEIKGKITSLSPLSVASSMRSASCTLPAGTSLSGFAVGDLVEMTCDLVSGTWVVRKLEHEHDDESGARAGDDDDDDDHSGPGDDDGDDDEGDDHSGPGGGDDDDEDDD